jgi:hypothetical protein
MNNGFYSFPGFKEVRNTFFDCFLVNKNNYRHFDEFTVAGTYNKVQIPSSCSYLTILLYGGGGGAQGGGTSLTGLGEAAGGGAGGGGGGTALVRIDFRDLPFDTIASSTNLRPPYYLSVTVGTAGAGGAGRNTYSISGNSGTSGGTSSVLLTNSAGTTIMRLATAGGGGAGFGNPGQRPGAGGFSQNTGVTGQTGSIVPGWNSGGARFPVTYSSPNTPPNHPYICGGGGSGGVINTDNTSQQNGGSGGTGFYFYEAFRGTDGGTGDGSSATEQDIVFAGAGGNGGASATVAQAKNGHIGGNGIRGGGGGGGGGCVLNRSRLAATLATGTAVVTLTTGNTTNLVAGDTMIKISGAGTFGSPSTILTVDSSTQLTMSANHTVAGSIFFYKVGTYSSGAGGAGGAGYCLLLWE